MPNIRSLERFLAIISPTQVRGTTRLSLTSIWQPSGSTPIMHFSGGQCAVRAPRVCSWKRPKPDETPREVLGLTTTFQGKLLTRPTGALVAGSCCSAPAGIQMPSLG